MLHIIHLSYVYFATYMTLHTSPFAHICPADDSEFVNEPLADDTVVRCIEG